MKTAMQELLEEVILERDKSISVEFRDALDFVITAIKTDYKEIEKQHIIDACNKGFEIGQDTCRGLGSSYKNGKDYYEQTFNK